MSISLTPETQRLIEQRMKQTGLKSPDELVRLALETLDQIQGEDYEDLPPPVRAAIDQAEAEFQRGEGIPADEAFVKLRRKHTRT